MVRIREYTEGKTTFQSADVEFYSADQGQPTSSLPVFLNPRMQVNRDFSVLFLKTYLQDNQVEFLCEPLAGSGVRTLRYLNEVPGTFHAVMFDANPLAVETAQSNVERLGFQERCRVVHGDAKVLIITESRGKRFDFIDVDPFGSPAQFLNAAVQSLQPRGGLLAATATDMPALCGVWPNVAMRKYGGYSIRTPFSHEIAVRLLYGFTYRVAGLNDRSIEPIVSLSTDHYVRVWLRVAARRTKANVEAVNIGFIRYCPTCMASDSIPVKGAMSCVEFQHERNDCQEVPRVAGPLWIGPLYEPEFVKKSASQLSEDDPFHKRVPRLLEAMMEEVDLMDNVYVDIHALCDTYNFPPPKSRDVRQHLVDQGYRVGRTHFRPTAIRTDAPVSVIVEIIRALTRGG